MNTTPTFFPTPAKFRAWLQRKATTATELQVGYWKVGSGHPSMTWPESVDEALCFGWIDGVRRRIDDHSYQIRFTPRKPKSIWSAVNIAKYEQLRATGRTTAAGEAAYARREPSKSVVYAYEQTRIGEFTSEELRQFDQTPSAWAFFLTCPKSYQKTVQHWVVSAKKPETRRNRLQKLIAACSQSKRME